MPAMRDIFWNQIFEHAKQDRNIVVLSADFSAPSLDRFRLELPSQYIRLGIAEQNMILMAAGLALEGKRPFCYAIAPFLTMRCFEQVRLYAAGMNLPITLVGVGAGFAYADSGYTHHALEDVALMRTLPHMKIYQPCDNCSVRQMADARVRETGPAYLRLDRYGDEQLDSSAQAITQGFRMIAPAKRVTLAASGYMVKTALAAAETLEKQGISVGVVDICTLPFDGGRLRDALSETEKLVVLDEHVLAGGLGACLLEWVSACGAAWEVHRMGLDLSDGYAEEYSGRQALHKIYHIDPDSVVQMVKGLEN